MKRIMRKAVALLGFGKAKKVQNTGNIIHGGFRTVNYVKSPYADAEVYVTPTRTV